jgi:hypothetical protein
MTTVQEVPASDACLLQDYAAPSKKTDQPITDKQTDNETNKSNAPAPADDDRMLPPVPTDDE